MGCRVIMVNRKEDQGEEAIKLIKEEVGEKAQIEWKQCDLGNLGMVKQVFTEIAQNNDRLDLVSVSLQCDSVECRCEAQLSRGLWHLKAPADCIAHPVVGHQQQPVPLGP